MSFSMILTSHNYLWLIPHSSHPHEFSCFSPRMKKKKKMDNYTLLTYGLPLIWLAYPWFQFWHFTHPKFNPLLLRNPPPCLPLVLTCFLSKSKHKKDQRVSVLDCLRTFLCGFDCGFIWFPSFSHPSRRFGVMEVSHQRLLEVYSLIAWPISFLYTWWTQQESWE